MFKQFFLKRKLKSILGNNNLSRRERCLELIEIMKGDKLDYQLKIKLTVLYPSITTYIRKLKEINFQIDRKALISSDMLPNTVKVIIFDSFFTDENNCYVDIKSAFDEFTKECVTLLNNIEQSDSAEYGYYEHTGRILRILLLNIEEVFKTVLVKLHGD